MKKSVAKPDKAEIKPVLTLDSITKEGIEISINQKDIIDLMVAEKAESLRETIQKLIDENKRIITLIADYRQEIAKENCKRIALKGWTLRDSVISHQSSTRVVDMMFVDRKQNRDTSKIQEAYLGSNNNSYLKEGKVTIVYYLDKTIGEEKVSASITLRNVDYTLPPTIISRIKMYNDEVRKVFGNNHSILINEKELSMEIKNKLTKEILKGTSSEFKQKLNTNLLLNL